MSRVCTPLQSQLLTCMPELHRLEHGQSRCPIQIHVCDCVCEYVSLSQCLLPRRDNRQQATLGPVPWQLINRFWLSKTLTLSSYPLYRPTYTLIIVYSNIYESFFNQFTNVRATHTPHQAFCLIVIHKHQIHTDTFDTREEKSIYHSPHYPNTPVQSQSHSLAVNNRKCPFKRNSSERQVKRALIVFAEE